MTQEMIDKFNQKRTELRETWVKNHMEAVGCGRFHAVLHYDFNEAPITTNRAQLKELGIDIGTEPSYDLIQQAINALSDIGVFFIGTDNISKQDFTSVFLKVIDDEVPDLPINPDCQEFVDVSMNSRENPSPDQFVFPKTAAPSPTGETASF